MALKIALFAALIAALALPASAGAVRGGITRADASADYTRGSIAGFVNDLPDTYYRPTYAWAYVLPNSQACQPYAPYPPGGAGVVWKAAFGDQDLAFDIRDLPLNHGVSPRLCLYAYLDFIGLPTGQEYLLSMRIFNVPPAPVSPKPPPAPAPKPAAVTLSRTTAYAQARAALRARFGRAYRRGKRKRLSCAQRSAVRYRCKFSFRYREKRRKGTVTVVIKPSGSVTTKVKRR